ncbi:MAG: YraN family protein [Calditrichaeota bacterium]|nr:YraN family protein [Calditrichota bacterium]
MTKVNAVSEKKALGLKGESLAAAFLEKNNHQIIARNYRSGRSEIDIISIHEKTLIITEVKSFFADPLGAAEFRVDKKKQKQVMQGVYGFLDENPGFQGYDVRLDVIVVDFSVYPAKITQHKSAFYDDQGYFY